MKKIHLLQAMADKAAENTEYPQLRRAKTVCQQVLGHTRDVVLDPKFSNVVVGLAVSVSCVCYLWSTYIDYGCEKWKVLAQTCDNMDMYDARLAFALSAVDVVAGIILFFEFVLAVVLNSSATNYFASPKGILDILTISPILQYSPFGEQFAAYIYCTLFGIIVLAVSVEFFKSKLFETRADILDRHFVAYCVVAVLAAFLSFHDDDQDGENAPGNRFQIHFDSLMNACTSMRILLLQRILAKSTTENNELAQAIISLIIDIAGIVFVASSLMYEVSKIEPEGFNYGNYDNPEGMSWDESLYFVVITLTTVGYGDYSPNNARTKLLVAGFVIVCFLFIPEQVSLRCRLFGNVNCYAVLIRNL